MPKIPLYAEGAGSLVKSPAGQTGPRASASAFAAPSQALVGLGQQIGRAGLSYAEGKQSFDSQKAKIDFDFAMAEKQAEDKRIVSEEADAAVMATSSFLEQNQDTDTTTFNANFDAHRETLVQGAQSKGYTKRRLDLVTNAINNSTRAQRTNGSSRAFDRGQFARKTASEATIETSIQQAALYPEGHPERVRLENVINEEFTSASQLGLSLSYGDFTNVRFEIEKRIILSEKNDEGLSVQHFEEKQNRALDGEGEFSGFNSSQIASVVQSLGGQINYMKTGLVAEVRDSFAQRSILIQNAPSMEAREEQKSLLMQDISRLNNAGLGTEAAKLLDEVEALDTALDFRDTHAFSDMNTLNEARAAALNEYTSETDPEKVIGAKIRYEATIDMSDKMLESRQTDPAQYIINTTQLLTGKAPSVSEIVSKQRAMGVNEANIKPLTSTQVSGIIDSVNQSMMEGDANQLRQVIASVPGMENNKGLVTRQLAESGMGYAAMYVSQDPDSQLSKTLMKASVPGALTMNVSTQNRSMVESVVTREASVQDHLESMGGTIYADFAGSAILSTGVDSPLMDKARKKHVSMVSDLTLYLIQEDGKFLGKGGVTEPSEIEPYATRAASILSSKYDYVKINGSTLRLKNHQAANFGDEIVEGIKLTLNMLDESSIYYESSTSQFGTPEYNMEKSAYYARLMENYGAITINGDNAAAITDEVGGSVLIQTIDSEGNVKVEPLTVAFVEAVDTNSQFGAPKKKELIEQRQSLGRALRDLSGKKGQEEERARLNREIELLQSKINNFSKRLAGGS